MNADGFRGFLTGVIVLLMIVFFIWLIPKGDHRLIDKGEVFRVEKYDAWEYQFEVFDIRTWNDKDCVLLHIWVDDTDYRETILECG